MRRLPNKHEKSYTRKAGFTLVEMLISLLMFGILLLVVMKMSSQILNMTCKINDTSKAIAEEHVLFMEFDEAITTADLPETEYITIEGSDFSSKYRVEFRGDYFEEVRYIS